MVNQRRLRSAKWNVRSVRSHTPFSNFGRPTSSHAHLQIVPSRVDSPTPVRVKNQQTPFVEQRPVSSLTSYPSSQLEELEQFPALQIYDDTLVGQNMVPPNFVLGDGQQNPDTEGGLTLEHFLKPSRRAGRFRRGHLNQSRDYGEAAPSPAIGSDDPIQKGVSRAGPAGAATTNAISRSRMNPAAPAYPKTPMKPIDVSKSTHAFSEPALRDRTNRNAGTLSATYAPGPIYMTVDRGNGDKIIKRFFDSSQSGVQVPKWFPVAIARGNSARYLEAFDQDNSRYVKENPFDINEYYAHKDQAIQQMFQDGQLEPISVEDPEAPLDSRANPNLAFYASQMRKQAPAQQTAFPLHDQQPSAKAIAVQTSSRSSYNPFATPLRAEFEANVLNTGNRDLPAFGGFPAGAAQHERTMSRSFVPAAQEVHQHDPFVSPQYTAYQHSSEAGSEWQRALTTKQWRDRLSSQQTLHSQDDPYMRAFTAKYGNLALRNTLEPSAEHVDGNHHYKRNEPRRTVLHDPFSRASTATANQTETSLKRNLADRNEEHRIAHPKPRHSLSKGPSLKDLQAIWDDPSDNNSSFEQSARQEKLVRQSAHDSLSFQSESAMSPQTRDPRSFQGLTAVQSATQSLHAAQFSPSSTVKGEMSPKALDASGHYVTSSWDGRFDGQKSWNIARTGDFSAAQTTTNPWYMRTNTNTGPRVDAQPDTPQQTTQWQASHSYSRHPPHQEMLVLTEEDTGNPVADSSNHHTTPGRGTWYPWNPPKDEDSTKNAPGLSKAFSNAEDHLEPLQGSGRFTEPREAKFNRVWYSGLVNYNQKMDEAAAWLRTQPRKPNGDTDYLAALLVGPALDNLKSFSAARKAHDEGKPIESEDYFVRNMFKSVPRNASLFD